MHDHSHTPHAPHAHAPAGPRPARLRPSWLRQSIGERLAGVGLVIGLLWAAVFWALS